MTDTILRNGTYERIESLRTPCKYLGERTKHRTKEACANSAAFLPVYTCDLHVRCSPYGNTTDPQVIKPCGTCEEYKIEYNKRQQ